MNKEISDFFNNNNYVVIRNFLTPELVSALYQYCKIKVSREDYRYTFNKNKYDPDWDGKWDDPQALNTYSVYADPMMDGLLELSKASIESYTGLDLLPQYSYWRFYQKNDILKRHIDRDSCEISVTMCIGYDVSDVDLEVYPNYNWPMFVKSPSGEELPIHLSPGDLIIYKGCEVEHWREEFIGKNHAQVFLHYNDCNGPLKQLYDGRDILGIPKHLLG
jgi:hypothetical protein